MKGADRKAAIAAYKEKKTAAGIYSVRCAATDQVWVGQSPNLDTIQNRLWFSLRMKGEPNETLQAAWSEHGADSFTFAIVERVKDDAEDTAFVRQALLKERLAHWQRDLGAIPLR